MDRARHLLRPRRSCVDCASGSDERHHQQREKRFSLLGAPLDMPRIEAGLQFMLRLFVVGCNQRTLTNPF
jgi:hypothetical protein